MNSSFKLLLDVGGLVKWQFLKTVFMIVTILLLPSKNLFSLMFTTIAWALVFDLFQRKPRLANYVKIILTIVTLFVVFGLVYSFFGLWGIGGVAVGGMIILLLMAGIIIYTNWKVYDSVTTWGARRIKGETKEDYNLEEVLKK